MVSTERELGNPGLFTLTRGNSYGEVPVSDERQDKQLVGLLLQPPSGGLNAIKFTEHISKLPGFSGVLEEISTGQQAWFATHCFTDSTNMVIFT